MKRKILKGIAAVVAIVVLLVAVVAVPFAAGRPWTLNQFYMRSSLGLLLKSAETMTDSGVLRGAGLRWYEDELDQEDWAALRDYAEFVDDRLETLHGYDRPEAFEERITYDAADWWLTRMQKYLGPWLMHTYTFDHLIGVHQGLGRFLTNTHKFEDADDARAYVARVSQLKRALEQVHERGTHKVEAGFVPPKFILEQVASSAREFGSGAVEEHPLVAAFDRKTADITELDAEERAALRAKLVGTIEAEVQPAWTTFADQISELAKTAPSDAGVWRLEKGDEYYADCLRFFVARDASAEELHQLGLTEVKRLEEEQWKLIEELGVERGPSIGAALRTLNERTTTGFDQTPEGIARAQKVLQGHVDDAQEAYLDVFDLKPSNRVVVKPVEKYLWDSSPPAFYDPGPMDGKEPGTVFFNAKFLTKAPGRAARALMAHEAIPGHHYQIFVNRQQDVPLFRKMFTISAVAEGWGLYAEMLADERGFYRTPAERLGYFETLTFRAHRLVVDTGIHHKHWTRQQAIDYFEDHTGFSRDIIELEVDRYCVLPGQATSYYTGLLEMLRLREKARKALGDDFDLVDFHHVILTSAQIPWPLIEQRIDRWIETGEPI